MAGRLIDLCLIARADDTIDRLVFQNSVEPEIVLNLDPDGSCREVFLG